MIEVRAATLRRRNGVPWWTNIRRDITGERKDEGETGPAPRRICQGKPAKPTGVPCREAGAPTLGCTTIHLFSETRTTGVDVRRPMMEPCWRNEGLDTETTRFEKVALWCSTVLSTGNHPEMGPFRHTENDQ